MFFVPPKEWLPPLTVTRFSGEKNLELRTLHVVIHKWGLYGQNLGGWTAHRRTTTLALLEN